MTLYYIISILLFLNLIGSITLIIINARSYRGPNAFWDFILCGSMFICMGLEEKAIPHKPEVEYVECILYFQNNKIEEPINEDGSRLCTKYLKEKE